jgi:hypothetical protein
MATPCSRQRSARRIVSWKLELPPAHAAQPDHAKLHLKHTF